LHSKINDVFKIYAHDVQVEVSYDKPHPTASTTYPSKPDVLIIDQLAASLSIPWPVFVTPDPISETTALATSAKIAATPLKTKDPLKTIEQPQTLKPVPTKTVVSGFAANDMAIFPRVTEDTTACAKAGVCPRTQGSIPVKDTEKGPLGTQDPSTCPRSVQGSVRTHAPTAVKPTEKSRVGTTPEAAATKQDSEPLSSRVIQTTMKRGVNVTGEAATKSRSGVCE